MPAMLMLRKILDEHGGVSENSWRNITETSRLIRVKKQHTLLRSSENCQSVYFVIRGVFANIHQEHHISPFIVRFNWEHQYLGDNLFMKDKPQLLDAISLTDSILIKTPLSTMSNSYSNDLQLRNTLNNLQFNSINKLLSRNRQLLSDTRKRILEFTETHVAILNRVRKREIASFLAVTPVTLSRLLAKNPNLAQQIKPPRINGVIS